MKKFAAVLLAALIFMLAFAQAASAGFVTTEAPQTTAATQAGREPELLHGPDITKPITVCFVIVCACIIYGAYEIRKHKNDKL